MNTASPIPMKNPESRTERTIAFKGLPPANPDVGSFAEG